MNAVDLHLDDDPEILLSALGMIDALEGSDGDDVDDGGDILFDQEELLNLDAMLSDPSPMNMHMHMSMPSPTALAPLNRVQPLSPSPSSAFPGKTLDMNMAAWMTPSPSPSQSTTSDETDGAASPSPSENQAPASTKTTSAGSASPKATSKPKPKAKTKANQRAKTSAGGGGGAKPPSAARRSANATASANANTNANASRNRRKEELLYLRDKVAEMEESLATLKRRRVDERAMQPMAGYASGASFRTGTGMDGSGGGGMLVANPAVTRIWEDVAERQNGQRQRAEFENAKLRAMLRTQLKVGKDFMRLLQKAGRPDSTEDQLVAAPRVQRPIMDLSTKIAETDQLAIVDRLYHEHSSAFTNHKFNDGASVSFHDVQIIHDDENVTLIDMLVNWSLPFSVEQVLAALWQTTEHKMSAKACDVHEVHGAVSPDDTLIAMFRGDASHKIEGVTGNFDGKIVVRKFIDSADHAIMTASMCAELLKSEDGIGFDEETTTRIRRAPLTQEPTLDARGSQHTLSQVQTRRRLRVEFIADRTANRRRKVGALTEFLLTQAEEDIKWQQQTIENLLLHSRMGHIAILDPPPCAN